MKAGKDFFVVSNFSNTGQLRLLLCVSRLYFIYNKNTSTEHNIQMIQQTKMNPSFTTVHFKKMPVANNKLALLRMCFDQASLM